MTFIFPLCFFPLRLLVSERGQREEAIDHTGTKWPQTTVPFSLAKIQKWRSKVGRVTRLSEALDLVLVEALSEESQNRPGKNYEGLVRLWARKLPTLREWAYYLWHYSDAVSPKRPKNEKKVPWCSNHGDKLGMKAFLYSFHQDEKHWMKKPRRTPVGWKTV